MSLFAIVTEAVGFGSLVLAKQHAQNKGNTMKKEYDFSKGVRGKYAKRYTSGHNLVKLDPELKKHFPDSDSVNYALRSIVDAVGHGRKSTKTAPKGSRRTPAAKRQRAKN